MSDRIRQQKAEWTDLELMERKGMIFLAAVRAFPTRNSWQTGKSDEKKLAKLREEASKVAIKSIKLGYNGWYDHNPAKGEFLTGLKEECYSWVRATLYYKFTGSKGWWDKDGKPQKISDHAEDCSNSGSITETTVQNNENGTAASSSAVETPLHQARHSDSITSGKYGGDKRRKSTPSDLQPNNTSEVNWEEMAIEVDGSSFGLDTRILVLRELMPKTISNPSWHQFDPQAFLKELQTVSTDGLFDDRNKHAYSLIYTHNMERLEVMKSGVIVTHNYKAMLRDFSVSCLPGEDTIKLEIECNEQAATTSDLGPQTPDSTDGNSQNPKHPTDLPEQTTSPQSTGINHAGYQIASRVDPETPLSAVDSRSSISIEQSPFSHSKILKQAENDSLDEMPHTTMTKLKRRRAMDVIPALYEHPDQETTLQRRAKARKMNRTQPYRAAKKDRSPNEAKDVT